MQLPFTADQTYTNRDFTGHKLPKAEYNNCTFNTCNFSESFLATIQFFECDFINCNFSNSKLKETIFKDVTFTNCKMIGAPFYTINNLFVNFSFKSCNLDYTDFTHLVLPRMTFDSCSFIKADFTESNLNHCIFKNCNLDQAIFEKTSLMYVDFRTSYNFNIHPEHNTFKATRFLKEDIEGLLKQYKIIVE